MSISSLFIPNSYELYIKKIKGDVEFTNNVHIDGNLVVDGTITPGVTPADINYSIIDPTNSKLDITGITKNTASNGQVLALDFNSQHLWYGATDGQPYENNKMEINLSGIDIHTYNNENDPAQAYVSLFNGDEAGTVTMAAALNFDSSTIEVVSSSLGQEIRLTVDKQSPLAENRYLQITPNGIYADFTGGTQTDILYFNPSTKEITVSILPQIVDGVNLVGNPIHQFVSGGSGTLDFRGMISPSGTINYNVTPTNIEMDVNIPLSRNSSFRANVDPTSNPDPFTNGLIIPMGSGQLSMPITIATQGLDIADPYINDDGGDYTINANSITINNDGNFCLSFAVILLGSVDKVSPLVIEVIKNGQVILTVPPLCFDAVMDSLNVGFGPYPKGWTVNCTSNCVLSAGDELIVAILPNNPTDDNVIQIVSNISMHRVDDRAFQGPVGPPGAVNQVNNDGAAANDLVENPGANANIIIKGLQAGTNVTITDNVNNLLIDASNDITLSNLGAGQIILADPGVDNDFSFKSLIAGSNINLIATGTDITISTPLDGNITQSNLGAGEIVLSDPGTANSFDFKTLVAGSNINLASDANEITISTPLTGNITLANLGAGEAIIANPGTSNSFNVKSLVEGYGVNLSSTANDITVAKIVDSISARLNGGNQVIPTISQIFDLPGSSTWTAVGLPNYNDGITLSLTGATGFNITETADYLVNAQIAVNSSLLTTSVTQLIIDVDPLLSTTSRPLRSTQAINTTETYFYNVSGLMRINAGSLLKVYFDRGGDLISTMTLESNYCFFSIMKL